MRIIVFGDDKMRKMIDSGIAWIGQIPDDWHIWPTKRFFRHTKTLAGEQVDLYERLALTMNGVIKRSKDDSEGLQPERFDTYQVLRENELVFKLIDLANVKTSRVGLSPYTGIVSPAYIILTNDNKDNRFYYYYFISMYYNEIFNNLGDNGVRSSLNAQDLLNIPMVDIPRYLQKRIADFLDEKCGKIDRYIEKQQQIIEKLKAYKQSVITEAVTKGLNPNVPMKDSGIEWIGMIPEHWEICKFGHIASVKSNLVPPQRYKYYPQVSSENIQKNSGKLLACKTVDETGIISDNHLFFKGQILYSKIRPALNKATIAPFDGLCSADIYPIETNDNSRFLLYMILSESFLAQVKMITENRVKMPKINRSELNGIFVVNLPYDEQEQIVTFLDEKCSAIDQEVSNREFIVGKLEEYKKSLIYEAVTGKLEV